jgi:transglutaminase-like putative cysteine protease
MNRPLIPIKNLLFANSALMALTTLAASSNLIEPVYAALFFGLAATAVLADVFLRRHPPRFVINIASMAILAASFVRVRYDTFIMVLTEAILLMISVKMFEEKRARDYCQIAALSIFTMLSAAVDVVGGAFLYYCVAASVLISFQLLLSAWFSREPCLSLTPKEAFQAAGRAMIIWVMMLPLCVFLFFAAPRGQLALSRFPQRNSSTGYTGFSDHLVLGSVRNIQRDGSLAFRAEMPRVAPKHLFWRGLILDTFDGRIWVARFRSRAEAFVPQGGDIVRQEIFMENDIIYMRAVFALDIPVQVNARGIVMAGEGVFINTNYRNRTRSYTALSNLSGVFKPSSGTIQRSHYLGLPGNFSPRIRELVEGMTGGMEDADKPKAIINYLLSPSFSYTMDDLPVSPNPLDDFIFVSKKGNCEYFAAAMAVMLRMAGIPSRLIAGYHGGVYNESGEYYAVSQSNAHVWVEAWNDEEAAWFRYDPTPISYEAGGGGGSEGAMGLFRMYLDYINYQISRVFMEYEAENQLRLLEAMREFLSSPGGSVISALDKFASISRKKIYFAAAALFAVISAVPLRRYLIHRRKMEKRSRDEALKIHFVGVMRRRGFDKKPGDGLEEFARHVRENSGPDSKIAIAAGRFVELFEGFYFRDIPLPPAALAELDGIVKSIVRG